MGLYVNPIPFQNDEKGRTTPFARLDFYVSGTFNRKDTYADAALTVPNSNPVVADGAGRFPQIFMASDEPYRVVFSTKKDASEYTGVWTADGVSGLADATDIVLNVDSIADLPPATGSGNKVNVTSFYPGWAVVGDGLPKGGGVMVDSPELVVHNGATAYDPLRSGEIGTTAYYNAEPAINCWVRAGDGVESHLVNWGLKVNDESFAAVNVEIFKKAIAKNFSLSAGFIKMPRGDIYIDQAIPLALSAAWLMQGESRLGTKLIQVTDNTPHFTFPVENIHSWTMERFSFSWKNQQTISHTSSHALSFTAPSTGAGCYLFKIDDVFIEKGYSLITTSGGALVWGYNLGRVSFGGTMVGQVLNASSGVSGQPSAEIDYLYVDAANMTQPILQGNAANGFNIRTLEIVGGGKAPALRFTSSLLNIRTLKCEAWTIDASAMIGRGIVEHQNSAIDIENVQCDLRGTDIGAGNDLFFFKNIGGTPNGNITVRTMNIDPAVPLVSGDMILTNNQGKGGQLHIKSIQKKTDFLLSDTAASDAASWSQIDEYLNNFQSADNGDADVVLDFGDPNIQQFNTTLTAGRTMTLPGPRSGLTDCFNGLTYRIVRNATTPGAFTLSVLQDGGGTLIVIPTNTNMIVEYTFRRNAWVLTNKVTL